MNKFKVGDIVEVDWADPNNFNLKGNKYFQGTMKVDSTDSVYLYFTHQGTGRGCSAYKTRFRLLQSAKEPKPAKKPHAWVTIEKSSGKVTSMRITRKAIRFQQKLNRKLDKGTVIRKITYEVV